MVVIIDNVGGLYLPQCLVSSMSEPDCKVEMIHASRRRNTRGEGRGNPMDRTKEQMGVSRGLG